MDTDNPAARALRVLLQIEDLPSTMAAKEAWGRVLGVAKNDESHLLIKLGQFMQVPSEAAELMNEKFPRLERQTKNWHARLYTAMTKQSLSSEISTFTRYYPSDANDFLKVMDQMLAISAHAEIDIEIVSEFKSSIEDLITKVLQSNAEQKVQEYLVKSLRKVIVALENYQLTGMVPVLESIEIIAGHVFTDSEFKSAMSSELGNNIFSVIGAIADSISIATGAPPTLWTQIGQTITGLIGQEG